MKSNHQYEGPLAPRAVQGKQIRANSSKFEQSRLAMLIAMILTTLTTRMGTILVLAKSSLRRVY
jgi:hypothetical protein